MESCVIILIVIKSKPLANVPTIVSLDFVVFDLLNSVHIVVVVGLVPNKYIQSKNRSMQAAKLASFFYVQTVLKNSSNCQRRSKYKVTNPRQINTIE